MTRFLNILLVGLFGTYFYLEYRETNAVDAAVSKPAVVAMSATEADAQPIETTLPVPVAMAVTPASGAKDTLALAQPSTSESAVLSDAELAHAKDRFDASALTALPVEVAATAVVAPSPVAMHVTGALVNARSGPGTGFDVLTQLTRGTELYATGDTQGSWAKVLVVETGQEVWMHTGFIGRSG